MFTLGMRENKGNQRSQENENATRKARSKYGANQNDTDLEQFMSKKR